MAQRVGWTIGQLRQVYRAGALDTDRDGGDTGTAVALAVPCSRS